MAFWLFKEEPNAYSFADLESAGWTLWVGVRNALAQKHLRNVVKGDHVFFYETGKVKAVVGVMEVTDDPKLHPARAEFNEVFVKVKPLHRLKAPVTLAAIKADKAFAGWELVKQARLSVVPVPAVLWAKIEKMGA